MRAISHQYINGEGEGQDLPGCTNKQMSQQLKNVYSNDACS